MPVVQSYHQRLREDHGQQSKPYWTMSRCFVKPLRHPLKSVGRVALNAYVNLKMRGTRENKTFAGVRGTRDSNTVAAMFAKLCTSSTEASLARPGNCRHATSLDNAKKRSAILRLINDLSHFLEQVEAPLLQFASCPSNVSTGVDQSRSAPRCSHYVHENLAVVR
jgi:hypothetical protein